MYSNYSHAVAKIIENSKEDAIRLKNTSVGPEHLLLGMMRLESSKLDSLFKKDNNTTQQLFNDIETLITESENYNNDTDNNISDINNEDFANPKINEDADSIISYSQVLAGLHGSTVVDERYLLLSFWFDYCDSEAIKIFEKNGINIKRVLNLFKEDDDKDNEEEDIDDDDFDFDALKNDFEKIIDSSRAESMINDIFNNLISIENDTEKANKKKTKVKKNELENAKDSEKKEENKEDKEIGSKKSEEKKNNCDNTDSANDTENFKKNFERIPISTLLSSLKIPISGRKILFTNEQQDTESSKNVSMLERFSVDLTQAARDGKLDSVIGRDDEIERVITILGRRKKNNPILIGEPGVGKTAIVEGIANKIVKRQTSPVLFNKRLVSLDLASVVAGTKYRGEFESRIKTIINEIEQDPNIIVFIDEIQTIIGAGSSNGSLDAANILKPALSRGSIQCIGATTVAEYSRSIEKDGALERRFQKIMIEPTSIEQTKIILNNIKDRYENYHHVKYTDKAIDACVNLAEKYVSERQFPDKAIDILDEVGSKKHLSSITISPEIEILSAKLQEIINKKNKAVENQDFENATLLRDKQIEIEKQIEELHIHDSDIIDNNDKKQVVDDEDISKAVSVITGIPVNNLEESEFIKLRKMSDELKQSVIQQDKAIDTVVHAIQRNRVGLKSSKRPIGVFMFLGPTGVGKTFLAKRLNALLFGTEDTMTRIDMSEYSTPYQASRLIGAPPGYVGYDEGGQLTEKVRRHPYSVILLDEIEKADPSIFNLLLQVIDDGRLTDGNGRLVDFSNTIIIMTSNVGSRRLKDFANSVGFSNANLASSSEKDNKLTRSIIQKSLSKIFSPEFLNRFDEIITFEQLNKESISTILSNSIKKLFAKAKELGYNLSITDEAKEFIVSVGYDSQNGARPLDRAIQTYIENGLSEKIINEEIHIGDNVKIDKADSNNCLSFNIV